MGIVIEILALADAPCLTRLGRSKCLFRALKRTRVYGLTRVNLNIRKVGLGGPKLHIHNRLGSQHTPFVSFCSHCNHFRVDLKFCSQSFNEAVHIDVSDTFKMSSFAKNTSRVTDH